MPKKDSFPNFAETPAFYAARENVSVRTIRNWMRSVPPAPLDSPSALPAWIASNKNIPPSKRQLPLTPPSTSAASMPPVTLDATGKLDTGAAAALDRLQSEELNLYNLYTNAPDAFQKKIYHDLWSKTSEMLRKFDLLVEESRRNTGTLYPRSEVERILTALAWYLRITSQQAAQTAAPKLCGLTTPAQAYTILNRLTWEQLLNTFSALATHSEGAMSIPGWAINALSADLATVLQNVPATMQARAAHLQTHIARNTRQTIDQIKKS